MTIVTKSFTIIKKKGNIKIMCNYLKRKRNILRIMEKGMLRLRGRLL